MYSSRNPVTACTPVFFTPNKYQQSFPFTVPVIASFTSRVFPFFCVGTTCTR